MNIQLVIVSIAILAILILGSVVYRRNPKSATNKLFMLLCADLALWGIATYRAVHASDHGPALFWVRMVMFLAVPQAVLFFLLMHTFPRATIMLSRKFSISLLVLMVSTMIVALSPYLFTTVQLVPGQAPLPQPGSGMILFVPVAVGSVLAGIWQLVRKNLRARGIERVQMRYMAVGVISMFALIIFLNFFAVVLFNITAFTDYGPLFVVPFVGATAYAITRYRLMDIRVVILRSLAFSVIAGLYFVVYGLLIYVVTALLAQFRITPAQHAMIAIVGVIVGLVGFQYFRRWLQRLTDQFLFKGSYDYRRTIRELGRSLTETIDLDRILALLTKTLRETVKVDEVIVFTRDARGEYFVPRAGKRHQIEKLRMTNDAPIIRHLRHTPGLLVRDEISFFIEQEDPAHDPQEIQEIQTAFEWLDVALIIPLRIKDDIIGLMLLGPKLSGEPFSREDLELLETLGPQAATAIENARLYREAQEFGVRLKREVEQATAELRVANIQLADLDKAKSEFLSVASHQLYTPLTALKGYLSMMEEGDYGPVTGKLQEVHHILRSSTGRLIELIRNLLDISRIESGKLDLTLESVDLVQMARELVTELTPNAEEKGLALALHEPTGVLPRVVADPQRLRQVLLNTLDNALKYTERGRVDVRIERRGDALVYTVQDTGRGLASAEAQRLFTKFTRVGGEEKYRTAGVGLGLYVARQMIREIHGDIWVESPGRGKGSTFFVRLPAEGSPNALKAGTTLTVGIKAGEAGERPEEAGEKTA